MGGFTQRQREFFDDCVYEYLSMTARAVTVEQIQTTHFRHESIQRVSAALRRLVKTGAVEVLVSEKYPRRHYQVAPWAIARALRAARGADPQEQEGAG